MTLKEYNVQNNLLEGFASLLILLYSAAEELKILKLGYDIQIEFYLT